MFRLLAAVVLVLLPQDADDPPVTRRELVRRWNLTTVDADGDGVWRVESNRLLCGNRLVREFPSEGESAILWTARAAVSWSDAIGVRFLPKSGGTPQAAAPFAGIRLLAVDYARDALWAERDRRLYWLAMGEPAWRLADAFPEVHPIQALEFGAHHAALLSAGTVRIGRAGAGEIRSVRVLQVPGLIRRIAFSGRDEDAPLDRLAAARREDVLLLWSSEGLWAWDLAADEGVRFNLIPLPVSYDRRTRRLEALPAGARLATPLTPDVKEDAKFLDGRIQKLLEKLGQAVDAASWKKVFEIHQEASRQFGDERVPTADGRWTRLRSLLQDRLERLPDAAFEDYVRFHGEPMTQALERHRNRRDDDALERAVEEHAFAPGAAEGIDRLARIALDEGRTIEAVERWRRLLRRRPTDGVARAPTVARMAHACVVGRDSATLDVVRRFAKESSIDGAVAIDGAEKPLSTYLESLRIPEDEKLSLPRPSAARANGVSLLAGLDIVANKVKGEASLGKDGELNLEPNSVLQIPVSRQDEYDLVLSVQRVFRDGKLVIGLPSGRFRFDVVLDNLHLGEHRAGMHILDGRHVSEHEQVHVGDIFGEDRVDTLWCAVRRGSVLVLANGRPVIHWQGDFSRVGVDVRYKVPDATAFSLGTNISRFRILRMERFAVASRR